MNDNESKNKYSEFYVYMITNLVNNKIYIGQTVDFERRKRRHINDSFNENRIKYPINKAIKKHGVDNFKFEIIEITDTYEDVKVAEIYWIAYYGSKNRKVGYNLTDGGDGTIGHTMSDEMKKKMSDLFTGRPMPEKTRLAVIKANTGKKFTDEHKDKIGEAQKGNKNHRFGKKNSEEQKKAVSIAQSGRMVSDITKQKLSETNMKNLDNVKYTKIKSKDVLIIRDLRKNGVSAVNLAKQYQVNLKSIYNIINKVTWKHI
jgi:group I intron endonuclease